MASVQIEISDRIYLKNPDESKLGRKILQESILLLDELGFEQFNFKKLAQRIGSTEASVYRYFENKHKLLVYLVAWYWNWLEYHFVMQARGEENARKQLEIAIEILSKPIEMDPTFMHIDESALHRVVVSESAKAYLTKDVDADDSEGFFRSYKRLCQRLASLISQLNPDYSFPTALIASIIESAHHQKFFSVHLPSLTEVTEGDNTNVQSFLSEILFKTIEK